VCAGGIFLTGWISASFRDYNERRQQIGPDSITHQQAVRLQDLGGQFLLTADLVVGSGESFLAEGNHEQCDLALRVLDSIILTQLASGFGKSINSLRKSFRQIDQTVQQAASIDGPDRETQLGQLLTQLDHSAAKLVTELQRLKQDLSTVARQREQTFDLEQEEMHSKMTWSFIAYLLMLLLVWRFQVRALVDPVVELSLATERARLQQGSLGVTPSGPKETQRMTVSISKLFDRLRSENQRVEEIVKMRTSELIAADNAKDEFLATVTHELRTPLNGVIGMLDMLTGEPLPAAQQEVAQIAAASSHHLKNLVDDILDITKMVAGRMQLECVPVNIDAMIKEIVSCMQPIADSKSVVLTSEISTDVPATINSDPLRLRQVLFNLVGNAVKFTNEGHVKLIVEPQDATDTNDLIKFQICDTGIGISPSNVEDIFQPFVQADSGTTRQHGGTGLGLTISQRLMNLFGGRIEVESTPNEGSTFSVFLPYAKDCAVLADTPPSTDAVASRIPATPNEATASRDNSETCNRVLVVDDNAINQLVACRMLEASGYEVVIADNGLAALQCAKKTAFGLVLMDLQMPVMDGAESMRELRLLENAGELHPDSQFPLPILALTANTLNQAPSPGDPEGFNEVLSKPIRRDRLLEVVGHYCPLPTAQY
jgi:signal transduction histidine kinase/CheY-like chemotaxis protein